MVFIGISLSEPIYKVSQDQLPEKEAQSNTFNKLNIQKTKCHICCRKARLSKPMG